MDFDSNLGVRTASLRHAESNKSPVGDYKHPRKAWAGLGITEQEAPTTKADGLLQRLLPTKTIY